MSLLFHTAWHIKTKLGNLSLWEIISVLENYLKTTIWYNFCKRMLEMRPGMIFFWNRVSFKLGIASKSLLWQRIKVRKFR